ncbi:MAG: DUF1810 domain-containing protein [Rhizobiaceae bacterium]|nr:MAG: DUF1810 domain-containing protein [Rhizobiaceae bacterium]CAG1000387.1 hypothetical protein RHIZO_02787 [Rhizobiaceae bacterium]
MVRDDDPFLLQRFVDAQDSVYPHVLDELRDGRKRSHWMWFVFPQIAGLGRSAMAERFAISGRDEARAYLDHPVLGPRLRACTDAVLAHRDRSVRDIFGSPDDLKFRSSMTLFAAAGGGAPFDAAINRFFAGVPDQATLRLL